MSNHLELATVEWRRVSPKQIGVELVGTLISALVFVAVGVFVLVVLESDVGWAIIGGSVVLHGIMAIFAARRVRSIGYQLREDDLVFRRGIMWQRIVAVPYGRMQLVDITRGPVARALGLAELKLVTAAAVTAVTIPGLVSEDAEELRDRLVELAESRRAGL
ncbi:PH domain-containing protein [Microbacteriaceae bacterium 4G12]